MPIETSPGKKGSPRSKRAAPLPTRYTVIGGVKVKLAPAWRLLPKKEDARLRAAIREFYGRKGAI